MEYEGKPSMFEEIDRLQVTGLSSEELVNIYSKWANAGKCDKDLGSDMWHAPALSAAAVAQYVKGNKDVRILDLAAGTGLVAEQLKELGFHQIDALEGSEGMLEVARKKNLYQRYFCTLFEGKVDVLETSSYDVLVCSGGLAPSHIQWYMLGEMIRCVKSGGLIIILARDGLFQTVEGFKDNFEPYVKRLESEGQWVPLERSVVPGYMGYMAIKFVFKVTKPE